MPVFRRQTEELEDDPVFMAVGRLSPFLPPDGRRVRRGH
jgi:hypothetical protein